MTALLAVVSACSLGSSRSGPIGPDQLPASNTGARPYKKIGVAPFEVRTQHTDSYSRELMHSYVLGAIRTECQGIIFVQPSDEDYPPVLRSLPRLESGNLDNLQVAIAGRQLGLNAVLVGTLTSVGTEEKDWGIWWLKQNRHYVGVQIRIEVFDTETATKLVDEVAARQVRIDEADVEMIEQQDRIDSGFIEEILEVIAQKLDDDICEAIGDQHWKSYVLSADPEQLWIASGSRHGLRPGLVLEVFDSNTVMEGFGGHNYFKPGPKVAEVKLVEVQPQRSKAVVLTGGDIKPLSPVKFKQ
ncbi:MAG: hypothetical protein AMJ54_16450 [Deltaproteobacteria bacterium SG8_13]|nr:MAG: hypothetical protein AMJ54_16450 [Deltaproteobacteria bacterium SG8_13]